MEFKLKQVLTKTPQGVKATRNGEGPSPKSHAVLKSFDGTNPNVAQTMRSQSFGMVWN